MQRTLRGSRGNLHRKQQLRGELATAEKQLWLHLRSRQVKGLKFRRQHGIGPYIVDFFCPERRLVIEVDGDVHALPDQVRKDREREEYLSQLGLKVIHYTNDEILKNLEGVLENLIGRLDLISTSPLPSLQRRGS